MDRESIPEPNMSSPATYRITVKGKLGAQWADWFNGTLSMRKLSTAGNVHTVLTCRVRDQAELLGVLNRVNSLNLPLLQVILLNQ